MRNAITSFITLVAFAGPAVAETIDIQMLNKNDQGERMVFSRELIEAEVGDKIRFIPTDKGHNAQSVGDAVPEGQEGFRGRINQEIVYEVTEPGLTAVICLPHQTMGMVALVVAGGDTSNADDIRDARVRGKGGEKLNALVDQAQDTAGAS
jgi:pseudoazurin